ncbi:MAG: sugar phosphate isomerase/epimerase [Treponema sp.]|nr:sugar phosphate isomerase/epimerase [Treponema sp.]
MKVGIDSYCYHRFFGEVYPDQDKPEKLMTMKDFLDRAKALKVDGVSLETCFVESMETSYLEELNAMLTEYGFDRVWAWGHPDGLERGLNPAAFKEMKDMIPRAKAIGADVMRVCGSSLMFRHENHQEQLKRLEAQFKEAIKIADEYGVKIAMENHIDYTGEEMLSLIEGVASPNFGINFDTGNFLRLLDDPIRAMELLAKYTFAVHLKDLAVNPKEARPNDWFYFSGVPVGQGLVDNQTLVNTLAKADFKGFLAVEIDHPHYDWRGREEEAIALSVEGMKKLAANIK